MNQKRQLRQGLLRPIGIILLVALFSSACGAVQPEPSSAPAPSATMTPIPIPAQTEAPIDGAIVSGRIYLMDRDRPVQTTVSLLRAADYSEVDSTETDEGGYYSFLIEEPDTYIIFVQVGDLSGDDCDPRTESGWQAAREIDPVSGVSDKVVAFVSLPFSINIGDEITMDCEQYCD